MQDLHIKDIFQLDVRLNKQNYSIDLHYDEEVLGIPIYRGTTLEQELDNLIQAIESTLVLINRSSDYYSSVLTFSGLELELVVLKSMTEEEPDVMGLDLSSQGKRLGIYTGELTDFELKIKYLLTKLMDLRIKYVE